ncbi:MAG: hypothetical protein RL736_763, partial [Pseudomonadota bacterium]
MTDLETAAKSLEGIKDELSIKIAREFTSGITKINEEFQKFFSVLFGGGEASLVLVKEELS